MTAADVEAVGEQMTTSEDLRVVDQIVDRQARRRVVRGDDRARTDTDDGVNRNVVSNQLPEHTDMCRSA